MYHPVRLIEEICMMDNLSNGRFQIGIGRGAPIGEEFAMWGGNPEEVYDRFDETFEILMKGLTSEFLDYHGKFYNLEDLWMELRPIQKPHPPLWYAGNPVSAGRYGANFIGAGSHESLSGLAAAYKKSLLEHHNVQIDDASQIKSHLFGTMKRVFIAETDEEARKRAAPAYEKYRANYVKPLPGGRSRRPEAAAPFPRTGIAPWKDDFETACASEQVLVGSPDTIREHVELYAAESGFNYLVISIQWGDITHEEASRSLRLFTSEVMPGIAE